ncbi:hypothetical protein MTO96_029813 [Rhipicephalus appendiculatus]
MEQTTRQKHGASRRLLGVVCSPMDQPIPSRRPEGEGSRGALSERAWRSRRRRSSSLGASRPNGVVYLGAARPAVSHEPFKTPLQIKNAFLRANPPSASLLTAGDQSHTSSIHYYLLLNPSPSIAMCIS